MILLIHISIALTCVIFTAISYFSPSRTKLNVAYGLVASTIASGTYLVFSTKANLLRVCLTGLLFVGVSFYGIAAAKNKLTTAEKPIHTE